MSIVVESAQPSATSRFSLRNKSLNPKKSKRRNSLATLITDRTPVHFLQESKSEVLLIETELPDPSKVERKHDSPTETSYHNDIILSKDAKTTFELPKIVMGLLRGCLLLNPSMKMLTNGACCLEDPNQM
jgi:hypothetical protein